MHDILPTQVGMFDMRLSRDEFVARITSWCKERSGTHWDHARAAKSVFYTAVFDKFDADGDCTINDGEYLLALRSLAEGSTADKLTEIFSIMVRAQAFARNVAAEVSVTQC